jgi:hypothetical protein
MEKLEKGKRSGKAKAANLNPHQKFSSFKKKKKTQDLSALTKGTMETPTRNKWQCSTVDTGLFFLQTLGVSKFPTYRGSLPEAFEN